jgi:hypothetical protein
MPVHWGDRKYDTLFGPRGWCVADQPEASLPCIVDGVDGPTCDESVEMFCINQCGGHGECNLGFCKCDQGDCECQSVIQVCERGV